MFFSDDTLHAFRALHKTAMMDECELLVHLPGGKDRYNMPEPDDYTPKVTLPCSFKPLRSDEALPETDVPMLDGTIAFDRTVEEEYGITITNLHRLRLTKFHGDELLQPELYDIAGQIQRDNLAIVAPVKRNTEEG
jgi:hypothetical protein